MEKTFKIIAVISIIAQTLLVGCASPAHQQPALASAALAPAVTAPASEAASDSAVVPDIEPVISTGFVAPSNILPCNAYIADRNGCVTYSASQPLPPKWHPPCPPGLAFFGLLPIGSRPPGAVAKVTSIATPDGLLLCRAGK